MRGTAIVYSGTKMCDMTFRIQNMDAKDDADIIAINLEANDTLIATVEGHAFLGVESVVDKMKHNLKNALIIRSIPPIQETNATTGPDI